MAKREVGWLYTVARAVIRPTFHFLWRFEVEGLENVPATGPAIVAPNHISVLDSFVVPCVLPRRITYVGKAEYLDSWKTRRLFPAMGMIAVDRSGGDAAARALDAAVAILGRGELFGIYPEGTRSRDGLLHKGHTGAVRLSMRTGAPIIPVGVQGTVEVMPPDARWPRPWHTVRIRFGPPIAVPGPGVAGRSARGDRLLLRQITDEVMYEIRELSGQTYVDEYATRTSEALPVPPTRVSTAGHHGEVDAGAAAAEVDLARSIAPGRAHGGHPRTTQG